MRRRRWLAWQPPWFEPAKEALSTLKSPCRICHSLEETRDDPLVAPCHCDGSLKYVHNSCQQDWLRHRRGPRSYSCELCRSPLACRLTLATRVEVAAAFVASAAVWAAEVASAMRMTRLALRLLAARWRQASAERAGLAPPLRGMTPRSLLPPTSEALADCEELAQGAWLQLLMVAALALVAQRALAALRRPLALLGEEVLSRLCIVKLGGSVLLLLHELLWAFPPVQRVAPLQVWHIIGATLLLDTLLLAFLRIPREDRHAPAISRRVALGVFRLTADFLPFAAVFFLWSASIVMIVAASLVPCMAVLFHEALKDFRRRRHLHGSLQVVALVLRMLVRVALLGVLGSGAACRVWASCDRTVAAAWLALEAALLWDILVARRGICCARETFSQVFWTVAVSGQVVLVGLDHLCGLGPATLHSGLHTGQRSGALQSLWRQRHGVALGASIHVARPGAQEVALVLCLTVYASIHAGVFFGWASGARRGLARALASVEPDRVVFFDCPHHRAH